MPSASFLASSLILVIGFESFLDIKYPITNDNTRTITVASINWLLNIVMVEANGSRDALMKAYISLSNFKA